MSVGLRLFLITVVAATTLFMLLPMVFIVALSFGSSPWLIFPPPSWTTRWYSELAADPTWMYAALASARVALVVSALSVALGFITSMALVRGHFRGKALLRALFLTPMILPVVILAVALYALFLQLGLTGTFVGFVIGHLIVALPFSIIAITNSLDSFDFTLEDAARICGASEWVVRFRVTFPGIRLGLLAAAAFSFLVSWDEVVVSIFLSTPGIETLPVKIWSALRQDLSPVIAAASSVLIGVTAVLMAVATTWSRRTP